MGKRGNENAQVSREVWEAQQENENEGGGGGGGGMPSGGFERAPEENLRKRRIIKIGRKWKAGGGSDGSAPSAIRPPPSSSSVGMGSSAAGAGGSNPFGGVKLAASAKGPPSGGGPGAATATSAGTNPFASVSLAAPAAAVGGGGLGGLLFGRTAAAPSTTAAAPAPAVAAAPKPAATAGAEASSAQPGKGQRLNEKFLQNIVLEWQHHQLSDWSDGVKDYLRYADQLMSKKAAAKAENGGIVSSVGEKAPAAAEVRASAANGPTPGSLFPPLGSSSSSASKPSAPAPAPAAAKPAVPFGGFSFGAPPAPSSSSTAAAPKQFTGFSFGSGAVGGSSSSPAAPAAAPTFSFGKPAAAPTTAAAPAATAAAAAGDGEGFPTEQPSEVGQEENVEEDCLLEVRAKYFKFKEGKWKPFASGALRLYRHKVQSNKRRMVLRNSIGNVQLNVAITSGVKFGKVVKKGKAYVQFVGMENSEDGLEKIMLQVKPEDVDKLHSMLEKLAGDI